LSRHIEVLILDEILRPQTYYFWSGVVEMQWALRLIALRCE